jgi:hypothetical protein
MQIRFLFLIFVLCVGAISGRAQSITEDPAVSRMMEKFIEYNRANTLVRGWRIQILSTTDRRMMESMQSKFRNRYPEYTLHFEHQNPYYHLKTGAFLTQQDARPMLKKMQHEFPGAFIVTDEFEIAEVLEYLE